MPKIQEREKYFVLSGARFLPASEAECLPGRIVRRVDEPINGGYAPEDPRPYYVGSHAVVHLDKADGSLANSDLQELYARIGNAFTIHSKSTDHFTSRLHGPITIVTIRQQQRVFDKLSKENADVQDMVMAMLKEKSRLYMIVGYMKFGGAAEVSSESSRGSDLGFGASIPVGAIAATAAGGLPVTSEAIEVRGDITKRGEQTQSLSATAAKGEVFAVAYTAIRKRSRFTTTGLRSTAVLDDRIALNFKNRGYGDDSSTEDDAEYLSSELLSDTDYEELLTQYTSADLDDFDLIFPS